MKTTKQIQEKHDEIEKELSKLRTSGFHKPPLQELHDNLTEQMATLRWVLDKSADWNEAGLRDT